SAGGRPRHRRRPPRWARSTSTSPDRDKRGSRFPRPTSTSGCFRRCRNERKSATAGRFTPSVPARPWVLGSRRWHADAPFLGLRVRLWLVAAGWHITQSRRYYRRQPQLSVRRRYLWIGQRQRWLLSRGDRSLSRLHDEELRRLPDTHQLSAGAR